MNRFLALQMQLPSSELTYPTLGKGKCSTQTCLGVEDMLVPRRVLEIYENPSVGLAGLQSILDDGQRPRFKVVRFSWGKISTSLASI